MKFESSAPSLAPSCIEAVHLMQEDTHQTREDSPVPQAHEYHALVLLRLPPRAHRPSKIPLLGSAPTSTAPPLLPSLFSGTGTGSGPHLRHGGVMTKSVFLHNPPQTITLNVSSNSTHIFIAPCTRTCYSFKNITGKRCK